jgi:ribosomal protein L37E
MQAQVEKIKRRVVKAWRSSLKFGRNARLYVRARLYGEAVLSRQLTRLLICNACPERIVREKRAYCSACGCPTSRFWTDAQIENKVKYLKAECPLNKWPK